MRPKWTFAVVSTALFMVVLDNLVVTTALPSIRADLGATIESLQWTVNAYTLSFAVLLLTGAALGDRFGRKRMFAIGVSLFTVASAAAALAPTTAALIAARAVQGAGAAAVLPLTLTLLSEAFPAGRRGLVLGLWSGISGLAVAIGPLVGGAVVDGISWHWIFWINVPIGIALVPLARALPDREPRPGAAPRPARPRRSAASACSASSTGSCAATSSAGTSTEIVASLIAGAVLVAAFVAWELRAPHPMLPMRFFRSRSFAAANGVGFVDVLRRVRLDLPAGAVPAGHAGPLPAGGRHPHAPVDRDADADRAVSPGSCPTGSARGR